MCQDEIIEYKIAKPEQFTHEIHTQTTAVMTTTNTGKTFFFTQEQINFLF